MKPIVIQLTPEQAHNVLILTDLALKSKRGGVKVAKPAMELIDIIQAAVQQSQKPDENTAPLAAP